MDEFAFVLGFDALTSRVIVNAAAVCKRSRRYAVAHDVFVSYSHHDKPEADAVCATLEAKGIRCWIAPRDVVPGEEWGAAIVDAIRSSRVMVLVFSQHANTSPQIKREVERAVNAEVVLIPFRIEDVAPERGLEYFLGTPHWLDALTPPLEGHLERLAAAVTSFLATSEPDSAGAGRTAEAGIAGVKAQRSADRSMASGEDSRQGRAADSSALVSRPWWRRKAAVAATAMVLVVIAALVAVIVAMNRTGPAAPTNAPSAQNTVSHQATEVPFIGLSDPVGVAVDNAGSVYVTDYANVRVLKLAGGSGPQTTLLFSGLSYPDGITVDGLGSVYITDAYNNRVLMLPGGSSLQTEVSFTGLNYPVGVAVDGAGNIYVVDDGNNRVLKLPGGRSPQTELPFVGLNRPAGVAVDSTGSVFVADQANSRVVELPGGAGPQTELPFTGLNNPAGVAVDGAGSVYVTSTDTNRVFKLPGGAAPQVELPFTGLNRPLGVTVDRAGDLYITDNRNHRALKLPTS
jgi:sugar lactone lactonase YvrE